MLELCSHLDIVLLVRVSVGCQIVRDTFLIRDHAGVSTRLLTIVVLAILTRTWVLARVHAVEDMAELGSSLTYRKDGKLYTIIGK